MIIFTSKLLKIYFTKCLGQQKINQFLLVFDMPKVMETINSSHFHLSLKLFLLAIQR